MTYVIGDNIFSGDLIFENGNYGRYDLPTGDFQCLCQSLKHILTFENYTVYPGHMRSFVIHKNRHQKSAE